MSEMEKLLRKAVLSHAKLGHKTWAGMNFAQCDGCDKHAHVQGDKLLVHNGDYSINELIEPEQF